MSKFQRESFATDYKYMCSQPDRKIIKAIMHNLDRVVVVLYTQASRADLP